VGGKTRVKRKKGGSGRAEIKFLVARLIEGACVDTEVIFKR